MNKYKTFEELKEELGDEFEEYMYKSNIELLTKIDKVRKYCEREIGNIIKYFEYLDTKDLENILEILGEKE